MYTALVMQRLNRKFAFVIFQSSLVLIGLGISLALYYSTSFYLIGDFVYNSDSLYLPALYADVVNGNNLSQWNLPPSSYIFPDALLFFAASAMTPSLQAATLAFGITQYLIFALGLMLLAKQILPRPYRSLGPGLIALSSNCFILSLKNLEFYSQMIFVSAHHFGVVMITPYVLAITCKEISESSMSIRLICILCALSFLTTLSDWLYLIQVAVPLAASLAIFQRLKKIDLRRALVIACALIAPSLFGLGASLLYIWNHPQLVTYMQRLQPIDSSFRQLATSLTSIPPYHAILAIIFLGICTFIVAKTLTPIFLHKAPVVDSDGALLPIYFFVAFSVNVAAVTASGIFADRDGFRYFLPVLILSGFWGLPFIVTIPETKSLDRIVEKRLHPLFTVKFEWAVAGALGVGIFLTWSAIDWQGFIFDYYPGYIQCINEKTSTLGIKYGIANYWQARPISLLSQSNLHVVQVNRDLSPYHWINNSAEYAIKPEFVVIDSSFPEDYPFRLDENLITSRFGKPDAAFRCDRSIIVVYRSDKFKFQFRDALPK